LTTIPVVDVELELRSDGGTPTPSGRSRPERPSWRERRRHLRPRDRRMRRRGLLFVAPWLIGLCAFYLIPLGASLVLSFTDYELVDQDDKPTEFIGLDNWTRLFDDPLVRDSTWVTLKFAVLFLPISIFLPLAFAYLLTSRHLWGSSVFRVLFYLPAIIPFIAAAFVWQGYLNDTTGWLNRMLRSVGMDPPDWLSSSTWALPALALITTWGVGNGIIIYMASLRSVPVEMYEAARLDGANAWQLFRHVTWPLISPVTFYNVIIALVALGQYFIVPYVLTDGNGDPNGATLFYTMYLYRQTFTFSQGGYGSAMAWAMAIVILSATAALFWSAKHWVHYQYERRP
jgi:multiple sugar transport system permease protein